MENAILVLNGVNGQLEVYSNKVVIRRKGFLAKMTQGFNKGDKEIYLNQISGIQVKNGGNITNGYIQFSLAGGVENTNGLKEAINDENTVVFKKIDNETVAQIKDKIEALRNQLTAPVMANNISSADEIKKFKELFDAGVITEVEFNLKKKELLGF
ncbi:DUF4429 domain-containing protein [Clostridium merdae]|uniref:DUF4429 domain-containing protein n=1 Tax=Clostridium merdae TaxID=1958780 RepID=UPI00117F0780|nr:DUF4429 domain-containing protein [Clostridium merdae]